MGLRINPEGELDDEAPNSHAIVSSGWNSSKQKLRTKKGMTIFPAFILRKVSTSQYNQFSADQQNAIRRAVKEPVSGKSKEIVDFYVKRSIHALKHFLPIDKVDTIIPLGSSSGVNEKIAREIKSIIPNAEILSDAVKKVTWKDVEIDYDLLKKEPKGKESLKYLESYLNGKKKNHPDETMKVSGIKMSVRRYLKNFMKLSPDFKKDVLERNINGKTVLVVDDTMEEGATMGSAYESIDSLSPKEIMIYVFLYTDDDSSKKRKSAPHYDTDHKKAQFDV